MVSGPITVPALTLFTLFTAATAPVFAGQTPLAPPAAAQAATAVADAGIPVESDLVRSKCGGCHKSDDQKRMSRISYRRASPENWQRTIERMVSINHAVLDVADARAIVRYLADRHGLAPEEARTAAFDYERRSIDYVYGADKDTADLCSGCHSMGRVISERRTGEEWGLLVAMHRGYFPLTDNQPIANGQGFRRSRAVPSEPGADGRPPDTRQPMDKAIAHLSKAFPLVTSEWAAWSASATSPRLAGRWALTGNIPGKGPVFGEVIVTADSSSADSFTTETRFTIARTGQQLTRKGKGLLYTGFQWRGRGADPSKPDDTWREVMFVERDRAQMWGRWFTGAYDETGIDVRLERLREAPIVLGTGTPGVKIGSTAQTLTVYGANLPPTLAPGDVDFGSGITVGRIVSATPAAVTLEISVAAGARPGPRDIAIGGSVRPTGLVAYQKIDGIRVLPRAGMARVGGVVFPKQMQQFEAMAFANGPDGKPNTDDDWPLGLVDVKWGVEEYTSTFGDDDLRWVGTLDAAGLFTPNIDGPNPERTGNRNNVGDVWITAEFVPEPKAPPMKARAHLLVTVPLYMGWAASEVSK